jgi:uncharacterized membrane protein
MINIQEFVEKVTAAIQYGKTLSEIQANTQMALEALRSCVKHALSNPSNDDKVKIRQHLHDAQAGLQGIDLDDIRVAPIDASEVRDDLMAQIKAMLLSL